MHGVHPIFHATNGFLFAGALSNPHQILSRDPNSYLTPKERTQEAESDKREEMREKTPKR